MSKLSMLVGFGAGYVLGARSGRERYEQIADKARELWSDPRVQEKAGQAQQIAKERAGQVQQVVKDKAGSDSRGSADTLDDSGSSVSNGQPSAMTASGSSGSSGGSSGHSSGGQSS